MPSLNKVFLMGNLTRDPDLRSLPSGQQVCELRLAVNRRFRNSQGQNIDDTCFVDVIVWGSSAKNCRQFLAKGSQVMVEGRLQLDQWNDPNGGQRSKLRVVSEQIQFLNRRDEQDQGVPQDYQQNGNYPHNNDGGYQHRDGGYPQPQPNYQPADNGYGRSVRPQPMQQPAPQPMPQMPPQMPQPPAPGGAAPQTEDDIPF